MTAKIARRLSPLARQQWPAAAALGIRVLIGAALLAMVGYFIVYAIYALALVPIPL